MADISAIKLPNGVTYNVKDNEAVTDITINSASIVNNGVASIPSASSSSYGVIKAELTSLDPPRPIVRFTTGFDPGSTTFDVPRLSNGKVPTYLLPIANADDVDVGLMDDTAFELFCDNSGDLTFSYNTIDLSTTSITPSKIGAVPTTRTVNSKALSSDITLTASDVSALPISGGTMTGQIKTSFHDAVAPGSYLATATTIPNLVDEVRMSSGCEGSFVLQTAYTKDNITISASSGGTWYNFEYIPHRSGGVNGAASGDNTNYGTLLIWGMTADVGGMYMIRVASGSIQKLYTAGCFTEKPTAGGNFGNATWTVHKYLDGTCEAYTTTPSANVTINTQWQNLWYGSVSQNLPSGVFTSVNYATVNRVPLNSGSGNEIILASISSLSTSAIGWFALNSKSGQTVKLAFSIMVKGTWK